MNKLMELIISTLLIQVVTAITCIMIALEFYAIFSKRFKIEKFFKIRKWFALTRYAINAITIIIMCYFKFYDLAIFMSLMMFWCALNDVLFCFIRKFICKK